MYKSPIEMIENGLQMQIEGEILKAVMNVGVHVDKEELLKALKHDRDQYSKGYADGIREFTERIVERLEEASHWETVIDEDGYAEDVGEVIYLDKAIEIIKEGLTQ